MLKVKRFLKRNSRNTFFKGLAGFGRSLNRLYENRDYEMRSNKELTILKKISNFNPDCKICSFEPVENTFQKQIVEVVRGDDFMKENKIESIDFLKLDFEGAEYDVLVGFEYDIANGKIKVIRFENGCVNFSTRKLLIDYYNFFESNDFIMVKIFPNLVELGKNEFKYMDFLESTFTAAGKYKTELIALLRKKQPRF